jgi:hypothetical protein
MRRSALMLLGILAGGSSSAAAQSAPAPIRLHYQRGPGAMSCPDEAQLREAIAAHLGSDPFSNDGKRLLEIAIDRHEGMLEARVGLVSETGTAGGERILRSSSPECRDLAAVIALAVSMVLDPLAPPAATADSPRVPPAAWEVPSVPAPPREAEAVAATAAPALQPQPPGPAFAVSLAVLGAVGAASAPNLGMALQLGIAWPLVSLGLEGQAGLPVRQHVQTSTGSGSFDTSQLTASFVPCLTRWHLGVCGLVSAGATHVTTAGMISLLGSPWAPFVGIGGRVFGGLPLFDWLEARLQLDLLGQVTQTTDKVNAPTVWSAPPVSGNLALALAARFR